MTAIHRAITEGEPQRTTPPATHRRKRRLRIPLAITAAVAASATGFSMLASASVTTAAAATGSDVLQRQFSAAADEFHVPQSVLLALSYQESRWESHQGAPSATGNYNVMGLTQVDPKVLAVTGGEEGGAGEDAHGTAASIATTVAAPADSPALHTLDAAARLIGRPAAALRTDTAQSVRGGAALLAEYQKEAGKPVSARPGDWYDAVVRFSQSPAADGGRQFADRVFGTVKAGAERTTADGQHVTLAADAQVSTPQVSTPQVSTPRVSTPQVSTPRAAMSPRDVSTVECPPTLNCDIVNAAYQATGSGSTLNYGNYAKFNRPSDGQDIRYIVIHDTEGSYNAALGVFNNPLTQASANYLVGGGGANANKVTQLVATKDVAWHAGNRYINMHSIGIEHEGWAIPNASWYTEQQYQNSATLTKYLAARFGIPLDRQHILGHDDLPVPAYNVGGEHWDPGTTWDWDHYMDLVGAPIRSNAGGSLLAGGKVVIDPPLTQANEPKVTGCGADPSKEYPGQPCPAAPGNFVYLYTGPGTNYPLVNSGGTDASDGRAKAVSGQSFVVAEVAGDWTAVWFGGTKAWFFNPGGQNGAADDRTGQLVVTSRNGAAPVYGRAFPEASAYPAGITPDAVTPLSPTATVPAGQSYAVLGSGPVASDNYHTSVDGSNPAGNIVIVGTTKYYEIRYNHRIAYVKADDVNVADATTPAPSGYTPFGPARVLDTRQAIGAPKAQVGPNSTITLQVAGGDTKVPANATSVILNVTAVAPSAGSFVTVYPNGQPRPTASNLNFTAGQVIPNLVVVPVVNGKVDFYNKAGNVDLIADITGYYSPDGTSKFTSTTPTRLLDTRYGTGAPKAKVGPNSSITLQVAGSAGVPDSATGVVLNVTATGPTAGSFVTVYPDGTMMPTVSNLNFTAGQTIPNLVIVPIVNGKIDLYNKAGSVDLIADITGYYSPAGDSTFTSAGPTRLLDTRYGTGAAKAKVGPNSTVSLQVAGKAGLPGSVTAVVLNVTAVAPSSGGFLTVYPDGTSLPTASNLNFTAGQVIPNLVVVPVVNGKVDFYNKAGNVDLIADIT
ncbi:N-acetylmuramoyl-L-alanine amidase, partial [Kitasatospora kazusensis]|uniref:N-acetylmuramoyl-L-alanine amidase n=1 Tax=Kitasatospora kazusensis TaxID=407974 RepID=UPI0031DFB632